MTGIGMIKKDSLFVKAVYILLTTVSLWSLWDNSTVLKLGSAAVVAFAFVVMLLTGDFSNLKTTASITARYAVFVVFLILIASLTYLFELSDTGYIIRGYSKIAYQFIVVFAAASGAYLFGERAIDYTVYATLLFNTAALLMALKIKGVDGALYSIRYFIANEGEAVGFMQYLELHDAIYTYGFFLLYYFFIAKKTPKNIALIAGCLFYFIVGYKRIGIFGLIVAVAAGLLLCKKDDRKIDIATKTVSIAILSCGFLYIFFIKYGLFNYFMGLLGINTMGRNELYEFIEPYYEISPAFFGRGFEFITTLFKTATYGTLNMQGIGLLHNGYLTVFTELGFWGFWIWEGFWLLYMPRYMKRFGGKAQLLYLLCTIYAFCTYLTDNTAFSFFTCIAYRLVTTAYPCALTPEEEDKNSEKMRFERLKISDPQ